jgi:hypothetical protein
MPVGIVLVPIAQTAKAKKYFQQYILIIIVYFDIRLLKLYSVQ